MEVKLLNIQQFKTNKLPLVKIIKEIENISPKDAKDRVDYLLDRGENEMVLDVQIPKSSVKNLLDRYDLYYTFLDEDEQFNNSLIQSEMYPNKPGAYLVVNASGTHYIKVAIVPKDEIAGLLPAFRDAGFNPEVVEDDKIRIIKKISDDKKVELTLLKNVEEHVHKLFIAVFLANAARQELLNMSKIKEGLIDYFNGEKYLNVPEPTSQDPQD